jgi:hypothetical protein
VQASFPFLDLHGPVVDKLSKLSISNINQLQPVPTNFHVTLPPEGLAFAAEMRPCAMQVAALKPTRSGPCLGTSSGTLQGLGQILVDGQPAKSAAVLVASDAAIELSARAKRMQATKDFWSVSW